jgi:predicted metal-dependent phosphoesterase TrpH
VCLALFVGGVVIGSAEDPRPERPEVRRGPWRVLSADFHAHSRFSDGFLSPPELVIQAERRGLDVLAVTEHNLLFPARLARAYAELVGGPTVLLGEEITTRSFHVSAVGIEEVVSPYLSLSEVISEIHRQGGVVIANHPWRRYWPALLPTLGELDAVELMHPTSLRSSGRFSGSEIFAFYQEALARGRRLTAIGTSDYHFGSALGRPRTLLFSRSTAAADVMDALRAGRTVVATPDGVLHGHPEALALLAAEPLDALERDWDWAHRGASDLDRVGRVLGLLGLSGMLVLRRRLVTRAAG